MTEGLRKQIQINKRKMKCVVQVGGLQKKKAKHEKKSGRNSVEVIRNCEYESANLIGLFWAVGRLKGIDETF